MWNQAIPNFSITKGFVMLWVLTLSTKMLSRLELYTACILSVEGLHWPAKAYSDISETHNAISSIGIESEGWECRSNLSSMNSSGHMIKAYCDLHQWVVV